MTIILQLGHEPFANHSNPNSRWTTLFLEQVFLTFTKDNEAAEEDEEEDAASPGNMQGNVQPTTSGLVRH